ncbi:IS3 family transposase [Actinopolymorpha pittospori]|uniref:IS3 family transposase n=1 Tax=Actinopolymorpha pittospori TaxID=648752 RepID=A0A927R8R8_9ACTN|nr:IS3 family transposase [Actinopolymorpha pittospori]MBE1605704.1 hypothetical protein [Actinopolymorpha pittospori]
MTPGRMFIAESTGSKKRPRPRRSFTAEFKRACELLKVSRAAYYTHRAARPSSRARIDAQLTAKIASIYRDSRGTYGCPRVHAELAAHGHYHSRKRVARLMRTAGLAGRSPRRWVATAIADPAATRRADLIRRDFTTDAAAVNTRWCGDITYIPTWQGWLYLATVIDLASRRIVGWATADHLRTELVTQALTNACTSRHPDPGLIFHSDRGCQGGFNWSSQHLDPGGVDGQAGWLDEGVDGQSADEVAGEAIASSRSGAVVLA